ncbi:MAG: hypothetical protein AABW41_00670 [Nanoarchaeota archaeon]
MDVGDGSDKDDVQPGYLPGRLRDKLAAESNKKDKKENNPERTYSSGGRVTGFLAGAVMAALVVGIPAGIYHRYQNRNLQNRIKNLQSISDVAIAENQKLASILSDRMQMTVSYQDSLNQEIAQYKARANELEFMLSDAFEQLKTTENQRGILKNGWIGCAADYIDNRFPPSIYAPSKTDSIEALAKQK